MSARGLRPLIVAALAGGFVLSGCTTTTGGEPTAPLGASRPTTATAAPTATTTTGAPADPLDGAPAQYREMLSATNLVMSRAALWWAPLGAVGMPTEVEWDRPEVPCNPRDASTPAWTCKNPPTVAVAPAALDSEVFAPAGYAGLTLVIGHEAAHPGQRLANPAYDTDDIKEEHRADCFAGAFQSELVDEGSLTEADARRSVSTLFAGQAKRTAAWESGYNSASPSVCFTYAAG